MELALADGCVEASGLALVIGWGAPPLDEEDLVVVVVNGANSNGG